MLLPHIDMSDWDIDDKVIKRKMRKIVMELKSKTSYDGHSTTLVTIWIPPGTPVAEISELINKELATAARIKSRTTRKHVQAALRSIASKFKAWSQIPGNGLMLFCGWTQQSNDLEYWEIIPPIPFRKKLYTCDSIFHVEVLEEMLKTHHVYGIIIVERDASTIGILHGSSIQVLKQIETYVHGKHGKGGQSQRRFERQIESAYEYHLKRTADVANKLYLPMLDKLKGIIIAGPAFAKEDFYNMRALDYRLQDKIIGLVAAQYQGYEGLREAINNAIKLIKESEYAKSKAALEELMECLNTAPETVVSGLNETLRALITGQLYKIFVAEDMDGVLIRIRCDGKIDRFLVVDSVDNIDNEAKKICDKVGLKGDAEIINHSMIDFILEKADEMGTQTVIIPIDSQEVISQLKSGFGGISGILR